MLFPVFGVYCILNLFPVKCYSTCAFQMQKMPDGMKNGFQTNRLIWHWLLVQEVRRKKITVFPLQAEKIRVGR